MHGICSHRLVHRWLGLNRTIRDLTCVNLEIPLVVVRLAKTGPKRTGKGGEGVV